MRKSAYLSDLAFAFCAAFLPTLCFLRYKNIPLLWAAAVSALLATGICLATATWMKKRYRTRRLKASEKRESERLALHLALLPPAEQAAFFAERAQAIFDEACQVEERNGRYFLTSASQVGYCRFRAAPLSADDTLVILSYPTEKSTFLLCNAIDESGRNFVKSFGLRVLTVDELYLRLKDAELLPEVYKSEAAFAKRKKFTLAGWLNKRNARPFLTSGALVLTLSLLSPFPYYYLIMGIALTVTAVLVKVFGKRD